MQISEGEIETIISYDKGLFNVPSIGLLPIVKRQDFLDDGSVDHTFFLELTEEQYNILKEAQPHTQMRRIRARAK